MVPISKYVLTDAGFWLGLCDKSDENHAQSERVLRMIERFHVVLPWPILYEVLRTKFVKNKNLAQRFEELRAGLALRFEADESYRDAAYEETMRLAKSGKRRISLVDMVVRHMMSDEKIRIDYFVTFNPSDFFDVCKKRKIEIVQPDVEIGVFPQAPKT